MTSTPEFRGMPKDYSRRRESVNWRSSPNRAVALNPPANQSVSGRNDDDRMLLENIILQSPGELL